MASLSGPDLQILELDSDGRPTVTYQYEAGTTRIQQLYSKPALSGGTTLFKQCLDPFLPAGYPSTVTPDYTPYQIYDSLQAFASTIAGLLASRAVFVGMGVGSENASLVTTMLLYIAQETIGRVATILFAHRFSQRIEAEVKFYRFFADIVNDMAFVLDCMSPGLPLLGRVCTLCVSNACRAMCGVAGGSSKAILSSHFAKAGNIGELNAKDGSQETVVSLMGMWVGGIIVSNVHGTLETWACLIPLLTFHLWANWKAVESVRLNSLNSQRATILLGGFLHHRRLMSLDEVGRVESVLGQGKTSPPGWAFRRSSFKIGASVNDLLACVAGRTRRLSQNYPHLLELADIFANEDYLLWFDITTGRGVVLLKESASGETQAKSYCHLLRCSQQSLRVNGSTKSTTVPSTGSRDRGSFGLARSDGDPVDGPAAEKSDVTVHSASDQDEYNRSLRLIVETLHENQKQWQAARQQIEQAGWELGLTNLTEGRGQRIRLGHGRFEDKKDR